ncbi:MAG: FAD-dependent monooxygenase [Hyphomicrobiales bacterium]|nr:FAD-dependent monooxygenase [Hyphomicrobiales bacterium]
MTSRPADEAASRFAIETEIAVIGGGLSGTLAAITLARAGYDVTLIDRHAVYPPDFRVEKIGGQQAAILKRLGLLDALEAGAAKFDEIVNARRGRILDRTRTRHYGFLYENVVATMRAQLPGTVRFIVGRVDDLKTGVDRQTVSVLNQGTVNARLIVLATGMGDLLRRTLGIKRRFIHQQQSLTFGFSVKPAGGGDFRYPALTYYGEKVSDGIDYLSFFPVEGGTRANLFTFRDHRDPWVKEFRRAPKETLLATLPGLPKVLGDFEIVDRVQNWLMDIAVAEDCRKPGIVLIGDAYQTSCPAAGTGVSRLLTDVERLCTVHVPQWLRTSGMPASKIAAFYDDAEKQAADKSSLRLAEYRRSLTVATGLRWRTRRLMLLSRRRLVDSLDRNAPAVGATLRLLRRQAA